MNILIYLVPLIILLSILYLILQVVRPPHNSPKKYLKKQKIKPVVMMIGDSITHGKIGTNFVDILSEKFDNYDIFSPIVTTNHKKNDDIKGINI